ncbi:MAG TPA: HAMP domain-containing sensor histidine kinase [Gaiellaceae bacterium]|nr:HAMP domain-containing sensor histidine kinase [Gaiellaceae bacterium]
MFRTLRFRLPALFLAGIALAVLIATALALRLYQDYTREQSVRELRREVLGLSELFLPQIARGAQTFAPRRLEQTTGDRIYYTGIELFPGENSGFRPLPPNVIDVNALPKDRSIVFEFTPGDDDRRYLGVARPLEQKGVRLGAFVVAKPRAELQQEWVTLLQRLAISMIVAVLIAAGLAWYLSRRISVPMRSLAEAADRIADGRYDVEIPDVPSDDEIGHLADRFREMAARLAEADERERNFLMSVSHELRTPLTAIRGHVDALREGVVEDPELASASLDVIAVEADRLSRLVGDILDLAKLDAHRFTLLQEEVDMESLCEQAYSAFSEEARRRAIDYTRDVDGRPVIVTDGDRVLQIISNLLQNAFRWTPDGGRIELSLAQTNGNVNVEVDDTGPGISAEERDRIFRPFVSRDGAGGTGLGLAIARELAAALGGRIELESEPGRGSRFRLVLPASR